MKIRKLLAIICAVVMIVCAFSVTAEAKPYNNRCECVQVSVDNRAAEMLADSIAARANNTIEFLVWLAQISRNPDLDALVAITNAISATAIAQIEALGFEAECEYVEYIIGGESVFIDPIIVIKK